MDAQSASRPDEERSPGGDPGRPTVLGGAGRSGRVLEGVGGRAAAMVAIAVALASAGVLIAGCGGDGEEPAPSGHAVRARVIRVIDGDTIEVSIAGSSEDVRYIGVDTPETVKPGTPVQCYGPQAKAENHRLVAGKPVRLVFDRERRDVYGRLLAYVHAGSRFVNAALVRGGYARTLTIPPNTAHASAFRRLEVGAGQDGRGLWGSC